MQIAYELAAEAFEADETPIGCVIVYNNIIIGRGRNRRNGSKNVLCHAEIEAINEACGYIGDWRLEDCSLFVTIEPCPMCAGAILQARIKTLIFGASNPKAGCCGSVLNLLQNPAFNHRVEIVSGIMYEQCSSIMKDFFKKRRG